MYSAHFFSSTEFGEWSEDMSFRLITLLDVLRYRCGSRIQISKSPYALGRRLGLDSQSCHNVDMWGEILAADCFVEHVYGRMQVAGIVELASLLGFTGIGIYPQWKNNQGETQCGFHFDVRPTREMGDPATWSFFNGEFHAIEHGLGMIDA